MHFYFLFGNSFSGDEVGSQTIICVNLVRKYISNLSRMCLSAILTVILAVHLTKDDVAYAVMSIERIDQGK